MPRTPSCLRLRLNFVLLCCIGCLKVQIQGCVHVCRMHRCALIRSELRGPSWHRQLPEGTQPWKPGLGLRSILQLTRLRVQGFGFRVSWRCKPVAKGVAQGFRVYSNLSMHAAAAPRLPPCSSRPVRNTCKSHHPDMCERTTEFADATSNSNSERSAMQTQAQATT